MQNITHLTPRTSGCWRCELACQRLRMRYVDPNGGIRQQIKALCCFPRPCKSCAIPCCKKSEIKLSQLLERSECSLNCKESNRIQINSATRGGGARCSPARVWITERTAAQIVIAHTHGQTPEGGTT